MPSVVSAAPPSASFDVIIVGAGVNGSGVARDCAMRGLRTLLLDKHDVCHGASGANTGMIHGGARYLLYDVATTRESCLDSGYIQQIAPHLLFRIPFLVPFFEKDPLVELVMAGGDMFFAAYDHYQRLKRGKRHMRLSREEALQLEPGLAPDIIGALTMDEWGIDPFRLVVGNLLSARAHGAVVRTYTEVTGLRRSANGAVSGVSVLDTVDGTRADFDGALVVNCGGAWAPTLAAMAGVQLKLRPGKGVHVVYSHRISNYGFIMPGVDGRQLFLMPHENGTICGTTDDDFYGNLDHPTATEDEVAYIREAGERVFPSLKDYRMQRTYVGIRPTLYKWGANEDVLSRAHKVFDHAAEGAPGLFTLSGGKLASFRQFAQEATDVLARHLGVDTPCTTHTEPLPGGERTPDVNALATQWRWPLPVVGRMAYRHGARTEGLLKRAEDIPGARCTVCACEPVTLAELDAVARSEDVRRLADLRRRTRLGMGACQGTQCLGRACAVLGNALDHGAERRVEELKDAVTARWRGMRPVMEGPNMAVAELMQHQHFTSSGLLDAWDGDR